MRHTATVGDIGRLKDSIEAIIISNEEVGTAIHPLPPYLLLLSYWTGRRAEEISYAGYKTSSANIRQYFSRYLIGFVHKKTKLIKYRGRYWSYNYLLP